MAHSWHPPPGVTLCLFTVCSEAIRLRKAQHRDCCLRAAVAIELVFAHSLRKTGIFANTVGDCRRKSPQERHGNPETNSNARKAGISGPFSHLLGSPAECRTSWLGREDSNPEMANWKSAALACPRGTIETHFVKIHKRLENLKFREPHRIRGVQSSGEK